MNSPKLPPLLYATAPDALFDELERELLALTTAELDEDVLVQAQVVDEFATEFLRELARPPK